LIYRESQLVKKAEAAAVAAKSEKKTSVPTPSSNFNSIRKHTVKNKSEEPLTA